MTEVFQRHIDKADGVPRTYEERSGSVSHNCMNCLQIAKHLQAHTHSDTCIQLTQFPDGKKGEEPQGAKVSENSMV